MQQPYPVDGSKDDLIVRRVVTWRRLEPGDERTPGTEAAPESDYIEARLMTVGVGRELHADLERLWKKKEAILSKSASWTARYEPAGVLIATGGGIVIGTWLDYLPPWLLSFGLSIGALGLATSAFTRFRHNRLVRQAESAWRATPERAELERIEKRLAPQWQRFATRVQNELGFRVDIRIGDIHEADRLVAVNVERLSHPDTWTPDPQENEVRYGWTYADGRVVEQVAVLDEVVPVPSTRDEEE